MTTYRIGITGAVGQMGKTLTQLINASDDLILAAAIEYKGSPECGKDAGVVAGVGELGVPIRDDIANMVGTVDICVDFSVAHVTPLIAEQCAKQKRGLVIGTTGLDDQGLSIVENAAQEIPIVMSPNMSVGVNATFKLIEMAAAAFGPDTDVEVFETHHKQKVDSPSGTAVRMGEIIAASRQKSLSEVAVYGRQGFTGKRVAGSIGMHSARGGDVVGDHTTTFFLDGERLEITHRSQSRVSFASGAIRAVHFVSSKIAIQEIGLYGMDHVLGIN